MAGKRVKKIRLGYFSRGHMIRAVALAALFSLLSLQITAVDHWHQAESGGTGHCDVCLQANGAALHALIDVPAIDLHDPAPVVSPVAPCPATKRQLPLIRGPPRFS